MATATQCTQCGGVLGPQGVGDRVASISGSIQGDDCTESWYYCRRCQVYTVQVYWDIFLREESVSVRGPLPRSVGDGRVALIRQCSTP